MKSVGVLLNAKLRVIDGATSDGRLTIDIYLFYKYACSGGSMGRRRTAVIRPLRADRLARVVGFKLPRDDSAQMNTNDVDRRLIQPHTDVCFATYVCDKILQIVYL